MLELSPRLRLILLTVAAALLVLAGAGGHSLICPQGPCPCQDSSCTCPCKQEKSPQR